MASDQLIESAAIDHPRFGRAVAVYDNQSRTRWNVVFGVGFVVIGIAGVYMGSGDLAGGSDALGSAYVAGGFFLVLWGIRATLGSAMRLRNPIRLVIGKQGFEYSDGPGVVEWDEVDTVSDPASPSATPRMLRVQLIDPAGFARLHSLSPIARFMLRANQGDLFIGRDMAMSVAQAENLMRRQLAESRRSEAATAGGHDSSAGPQPRTTAPRGRRPTRKR